MIKEASRPPRTRTALAQTPTQAPRDTLPVGAHTAKRHLERDSPRHLAIWLPHSNHGGSRSPPELQVHPARWPCVVLPLPSVDREPGPLFLAKELHRNKLDTHRQNCLTDEKIKSHIRPQCQNQWENPSGQATLEGDSPAGTFPSRVPAASGSRAPAVKRLKTKSLRPPPPASERATQGVHIPVALMSMQCDMIPTSVQVKLQVP